MTIPLEREAPARQPGARADDAPAHPPCPVTIVAHHVGRVGGMERVLSELALGLRRRGHEVTVIAHACELPPGSGVRFHRVRGPSRPFLLGYPWFLLAGSLAVRRHAHGVVHSTGAIVVNRVEVIGVHYCHQVGAVTPSRANWVYRTHVRATRLLSRIGERLIYNANASATFVCVSEGVAEEIRSHYPKAAERVLTIHNGVDTERFAPGVHAASARELRRALGIPPDRLVAAFVGSEWKRKGLASAIEAIALATEWDLVVAGGGDEAHYRELARSLGAGERVHWIGVERDVHVVYALADAFVLPSSYETFSLVSFEAASSGLPVLATPVSGVRELIEDGVNGYLITSDERLIADRLAALARDPALRERLGEAARRSALRFTWEETVRKHEALYERLCEAARR